MALELVGDLWSLLIIRDLMFKGRHTFKEFLEAGEGIASNVLTDRLRRLAEAGILGRQPDLRDRRRVVYTLTLKGIDLAPVLVELVAWSAKHHQTGAPPAIVRLMREQREAFIQGIYGDWSKSRRGTQGVKSAKPTVTQRRR